MIAPLFVVPALGWWAIAIAVFAATVSVFALLAVTGLALAAAKPTPWPLRERYDDGSTPVELWRDGSPKFRRVKR